MQIFKFDRKEGVRCEGEVWSVISCIDRGKFYCCRNQVAGDRGLVSGVSCDCYISPQFHSRLGSGTSPACPAISIHGAVEPLLSCSGTTFSAIVANFLVVKYFTMVRLWCDRHTGQLQQWPPLRTGKYRTARQSSLSTILVRLDWEVEFIFDCQQNVLSLPQFVTRWMICLR